MSTDLEVGVVLINWNGGAFTIPCIESLLSASNVPSQIVVVDNASTDGSDNEIARQFPTVRLIRNKENLGFTGGNNVGIRALLDQGADLIWILNNDTVVDAECLKTLVAELQDNQEIAAVTGKILQTAPADMIWYAGGGFHRWSFSAYHRGVGETDSGKYDTPEDVGFVSGCCMLVRRSVIDQVGMFHEHYFCYDEDFDWCLRAGESGLRLRYVPQAILHHSVSATIRKNTLGGNQGTTSPLAHYLITRNRILTIRHHADRPLQLISGLLALLANRLYISTGLIAFRRWKKLSRLWRGISDGLSEDPNSQYPMTAEQINELI